MLGCEAIVFAMANVLYWWCNQPAVNW